VHCPGKFLGDTIFDKAIMSRLGRTAGISLRKANLLTLGGFCALYIGLMGILMAINVPVISGFRRPVTLVLSAIALAGLTAMLIARLTKADESEQGDAPKMGNHPPAANR
jgi:hypothetical protein